MARPTMSRMGSWSTARCSFTPADGEPGFRSEGLMFALLGSADPATLTRWFEALADGGTVIDPLQERPWGASDGQVRDRYGLHWLVGFEPQSTP